MKCSGGGKWNITSKIPIMTSRNEQFDGNRTLTLVNWAGRRTYTFISTRSWNRPLTKYYTELVNKNCAYYSAISKIYFRPFIWDFMTLFEMTPGTRATPLLLYWLRLWLIKEVERNTFSGIFGSNKSENT